MPWWEHYDKREVKTLEAAQAWSEQLIEWFNETLRPGEQKRKLLAVELEGKSEPGQHDWYKTNMYTLLDNRLGMYDAMICRACRITGKRFGLNEHVKVDSKFRAKKYQKCQGVEL